MRRLLVAMAFSLVTLSCAKSDAPARMDSGTSLNGNGTPSVSAVGDSTTSEHVSSAAVDTAIFAGGCFWCVEPPYDTLDGVRSTTSGYTAGSVVNPTYEQVSAGSTGHTEALQVVFDPTRVTYGRLLDVFWRNIDPFARNQQFCDRGNQYRSGIYPRDASQKAAAEASLRAVAARFSQPIATEIVAATPFYAAEDYHQNYYQKNPLRYKFYRANCGRDARLNEIWGDDAGQ